MKHLLKSIIRYTHLEPTPDVSSWCGQESPLDEMMIGAALSDCEACLKARSNALHFQPGSIPGSLAKDGSDRPIVSAKSPGGADGARGPGDTGRRAVALLKRIVIAKTMGDVCLIDSSLADALWRDVQSFLAEEIPGTTNAAQTKEK